ncbi:MAG: tetratricopeptide repeat protein [Treponema sp.]|nr:tetratricopeptide repeat protein [Treponema sp.]
MKQAAPLIAAALCLVFPLAAQESPVPLPADSAVTAPAYPRGENPDFKRGEELFVRNKSAEALPYLEKAFVADQGHLEAALYLAMCYEQTGKLDEAVMVYRKILPSGGDRTALIACNLGNVYFRQGSVSFAEQFYTQAIRADPSYASAYLNRANSRIKAGALREALPDYERYLALEPESPKRSRIEQLVGLIREEFAAAEIRRLMAEEAARAAAEQKAMEEAAARAEEERRVRAAEAAARAEEERRVRAEEAAARAEAERQIRAEAEARAEAEQKARAEEAARAEEERRRRVEEEAARAEAERRRRLMEEVSTSLQAQAEDAEGVSAGAEDLSGYEGEFELE